MSAKKILIVDDEPDIRELLEITLSRMGLQTTSCGDLAAAYQALAVESFDLCLSDMNLPDGNGLELVSFIQEKHAQLPIAIITAYGSVDTAISALKQGAFDFVSKPVDLEQLRGLVQSALKVPSRISDLGTANELQLLGESDAATKLRRQITKLARSQAPVYVSGESGSGKELVARLIHANGPRAEAPFVAVNCGAIPSELMESEFFGHLKGSFTGAVADKPGLFKAADGGSLFLDEVADLPLGMQVKLLRAIQEKSVRAIGDNKETPVDVRILSATHKDLAKEVDGERFRQDLFYRINVIELPVPPLRARAEDIRIIAHKILQKFSSTSNEEAYTLSDDAWQSLNSYGFPGNVRELQNILERACALSDDKQIQQNELQLQNRPSVEQNSASSNDTEGSTAAANEPLYPTPDLDQEVTSLDSYLEDIERQVIYRALEKTRWNKTAAAEMLGISFRALRYKLSKLEIK